MSTPSTIVYGLYQGLLLPHRLGGLSRGLEWWVEGPFLKTRKPLHRTILSAGRFLNGDLGHPGNTFGAAIGSHSLAELIEHLLSEHRLVAVIEDGTVQSPEHVVGRETYSLSRMGMAKLTGFARWEQEIHSLADIQQALDFGAKAFLIDPQPRGEDEEWNPVTPIDAEDMNHPPVLPELLRQAVQWLIGNSNGVNDTHRYVPQALWDVTPLCAGVLVFHADRDSDCLAVYSEETLDWQEKMDTLPAIQDGDFWISCQVPTMSLRWKRALYEACDNWDGDCPEALRALVPVQQIDEPSEDLTEQESADESEEKSSETTETQSSSSSEEDSE